MTERPEPRDGVVPARPELGGGAATPSYALPDGAPTGLPGDPVPIPIGSGWFAWGARTYVMGILNVTADSFSGDGLLAETDDPVAAAGSIGAAMVAAGADILDVGGESTRPGHAPVDEATEGDRVVPVVRALRATHPGVPISVDTTKASVATAAIDAGADLVNDVAATTPATDLLRVVAERGVPVVLMHDRPEARYRNVVAEVLADLQRAIDRALAAGVAWERIIVDPGFGFGKTPAHNLVLLRELSTLRTLRRPILLGTSRKSTLGKLLDLPPEERLEATLATTALAVAAGVDLVRVHDVGPNVRVARVADAIVRGGHPLEIGGPG